MRDHTGDIQILKELLEEKFKTKDHPKASLLFQMAWQLGHAGGEFEVVSYYSQLIELIQK